MSGSQRTIEDTDRALVTLVPHTTAARSSRFECSLRIPFLKEGAFDAQGIVTVPTVKLLRRLGTLQSEQLAKIEQAVAAWLGLRHSQ